MVVLYHTPVLQALDGCSISYRCPLVVALLRCVCFFGGGVWHVGLVYCSRLQLAAPIGRSPFTALPLDPFPPSVVVLIGLSTPCVWRVGVGGGGVHGVYWSGLRSAHTAACTDTTAGPFPPHGLSRTRAQPLQPHAPTAYPIQLHALTNCTSFPTNCTSLAARFIQPHGFAPLHQKTVACTLTSLQPSHTTACTDTAAHPVSMHVLAPFHIPR